MSSLVTVIARFRAKPGKEGQLRKELLALVGPTHKESGCLNYDLHESDAEPGLFFFHENWTTKAAIEAHFETPHIQGLKVKVENLLAEPLEVHLLSMISQVQK